MITRRCTRPSRSSPASRCTRRCIRPAWIAERSPGWRDQQGFKIRDDDTWSDIFSQVLTERHRAESRPLPPGDPVRVSGARGGARPAQARPSARRRALRALRLRRRTGERLRRTDGCPANSAGASQTWMDEKERSLRRALPDRRGFPRRSRAYAAVVGLRARLRPSGHAGDRRHTDRSGALDTFAGRRHVKPYDDRCFPSGGRRTGKGR